MKGGCFYFCFFLILMMFLATNNVADASALSGLFKFGIRIGKIIFKHVIKTNDEGSVVCVPISDQPAFDHPLLGDHEIKQLQPSNYPQGFLFNSIPNQITDQEWQLSGTCPNGTIPMNKETYFEQKILSFKKSPFVAGPDDFSGGSGHEYAIYRLGQGKYDGAKAVIDTRKPRLEMDAEFTLSQIWLVAGSGYGSDLETIEVGWHVNPRVNKDRRTRLFVYWTRDNYETSGCYNLECPGFVQTSNQILIGGSITDSGEITLLVFKDERQKVWWLIYNEITVGYWPFSLFRLLQGSASRVDFGGEITNKNTNTTKKMVFANIFVRTLLISVVIKEYQDTIFITRIDFHNIVLP